jgi:cytochrome b
MTNHAVWDLPSRFIHWCFPVGVGLMWWTGETGRMELHSYVAYVLLTLVITRLALGFVGSYHSRFGNFLVGPAQVVAYVREGGQYVGHNPLGALSTVALLTLMLAQGVSGLFSVDDIAFDGPLAYAFDGKFIDVASEWHHTNWGILRALIFLHLAAIAWYQWRKRQPLIQAMWHGRTGDRVGEQAPVNTGRAITIAVIVAATLWLAITYAPEAPSYY